MNETYHYNYATLPEHQKKRTEQIQLLLVEEQLIVQHVSVTADDSVLFELQNAGNALIIDVYSHVVIVLRSKGEELYSWSFDSGEFNPKWDIEKVRTVIKTEL